jgi:CxxC-x17-CxxC domain-containing protein
MGNFNDRGGRGGFRGGNGGGNFRKGGFGGGRGGNRANSMHKAVCNECHKDCEVPFRPSSDKPIYCDDCFRNKRGNESPRRDFGDRGQRKDFGNKSNFGKPKTDQNQDELKKQMTEINHKLDRLINIMEKSSNTSKSETVVVLPKTVEKIAPVLEKKTKIQSPKVSKKVVKKVVAKKPIAKKKK